MAVISSLGVGANLDLSGLLDKLAASESAPLVALQKQQTSYTAKLSAYGTLKNALSNFQAAASKLADATLFKGATVASSAADVLSASADSTAVAGSYAVSVTQLAQAQSLVSGGVASTTSAIGAGGATTVTIGFGTIAGTLNTTTGTYNAGATFTADAARPPVSLTIDSTNNTLAGIRDAVNKTTGIGVTASIVNDGTTNRLVLTSTMTGQKSSMRISVTGDAAVGSLLANDPAGTQNLKQTITATDAALTVNGIAVTSTTNTVASSVQGVTMTLAKIGSSTLTVSRDTASVESAVAAFVNAYNALQATASQLTKYDLAKKSGAALVGDSTLRSIQTGIRSALNTPQAGALKVLSSVGVSFQKDGTIAFDAAKLKTAFAGNREAVVELFAGAGGNAGMGTQVAALVETFTGSSGKLSNATAGVNATLKSLDTRYAATEVSVGAKVARYRAQFTQLDMMMARMNATTSYLTSQFSAMNPSK
ncbi:MAG: flagellar filament capping protein FliD [Polaromonas sp. 39-63-203]|jgi:flagellar hook-associated protein 2|uniref:flagellar filament capping protein FliD n=1 Tax=Polaromonas sp. TaxID=1869339 RepID=UPI000BCD469A|nr:flagellar filament capping protein FliD [Polaromonas sp.]OYY53015.1 MAG: flagellar filament capping protein FliD [Polaromonas sp. 35-63-240]OYZ84173.1 MAG: flagellar filament capping protein FliD [Polaromonas sp. 24-62-144]OZA99114.1 MAG: flagellar filament capping protein FliD [Polaromonas sp. 39-63-203]HQS31598.1 flagellar filament capping protein FliD [Polaromonas sp.]HQS90071.1 flagellar filament capping protein FliD [Polaromonas sp.]